MIQKELEEKEKYRWMKVIARRNAGVEEVCVCV